MAKASKHPETETNQDVVQESVLPDDRERLLSGFERILIALQSTLDLNEILDTLAEEALNVGLFKSLMIALVDDERNQVIVRRRINRFMMSGDRTQFNREPLAYPLHDFNITAEVAREGKLTVIDGWDDRFLSLASPDNRDTGHTFENRSFYFIPVKVRNQVTAVLATGSPRNQKDAYLSHIRDMQPILDQIGLVLHHAHLYERTQQSAAEVEEHQRLVRGMHEIGRSILATSDLEEALDTLVLQITESGVFRSLMVGLVDQDTETVTLARRLGQKGKTQPYRTPTINRVNERLPFSEAGVVGEVSRTGKIEIVEGWDDRYDIDAVEADLKAPDRYEDNVAYFIPVKHESRVLAVLATGSTIAERSAIEARIAAMGPLLDQVAVAILHTQLFREMKSAQGNIEEKSRQLESFNTIGRAVLESKDLESIIETLMIQIGETGLFRSLTFSSVDLERQKIILERTMNKDSAQRFQIQMADPDFPETDLNGPDITAVVARTRQRTVIQGWDDRYQSGIPGSHLLDPANYSDKVAYFVPIVSDGQTIAVLATGSKIADREATERRLEAMTPLLDLVAVAIGHARMVSRLSDETARLDTQIEAHERENLGLLRINALIQSITRADDLENVVRGIYDELIRFGIQIRGMTIRRVVDREHQRVEQYEMRPNAQFRRGSGRDERAVSEWLESKVTYRSDVESHPEGLPEGYFENTYSSYGIRVASILTVPYKQGIIAFRSDVKNAFSDSAIQFTERIAGVLSVGMSRIDDLEKVDRAHRFDAALLGISQLCADLVSIDGFEALLREMLRLLRAAGISADGMALHRQLEAETERFQSWWLSKDSIRSRIAKKKNLRILADGRNRYRRNLAADLEDLPPEYRDIAIERYGVEIRATLEIPFGQGILTLVSSEPSPYSETEIDFVERTAKVLAVGMARVSDLEALEKRNREQQALLAVSQAVADMTTSDALPTILGEVKVQLSDRGLPLVGLALHTLADTGSAYESIRIMRNGSVEIEQLQSDVWYDHWASRDTTYLPDLQNEPHDYPEGFSGDMETRWGSTVGSVLVVPHSRGVMVLPCEHARALNPEDIAFIERIAQIISLGTARLDDLRGLELRAHELAREQDFSHSLVESMLEGFVVTDVKTNRHVEVNPALCKMTGFSREELVGTDHPRPYWPPECLEQIAAASQAIEAGRFVDFDLTFMRKNGERFPVTVTPAATYDDKGNIRHYIATIRDVSSRKQLENERIQTQRLRAAGELSAGICHNLNNILTGVIGPAQLLKMQSDDDTVIRHVEAILTSAKRATDIVQQLYQGTTQRTQELEEVDLERAVQEAIQGASPRWKDEAEARGIRFDVEYVCEASPPIQGTIAQVHDIVLNLIFNAIDAQAEGGKILLRTTQMSDHAILTVTDNGVGMNEDTKARIFEPFFTTKMDVGTGLGLATVYNTMAQWGGSIEAESEPGKGTTFKLRFPLWTGDETTTDSIESPQGTQTNAGRILVIDDDDNVASFLAQALSTEHSVDRAGSGKEALDRLDLEAFDLAVIDLGMAEMAGDRVGRIIREAVPGIGTVLVSGWDLAGSDSRLKGFDAYLKKPFSNIRDLLSKTQEVVELSRKRRT